MKTVPALPLVGVPGAFSMPIVPQGNGVATISKPSAVATLTLTSSERGTSAIRRAGWRVLKRVTTGVVCVLMFSGVPTFGFPAVRQNAADQAPGWQSSKVYAVPTGFMRKGSNTSQPAYRSNVVAALRKAILNDPADRAAMMRSAVDAEMFLGQLGCFSSPTLARISEDNCFSIQWRNLRGIGLLLVFSGDGEATFSFQSATRSYAEWTNFLLSDPVPKEVVDAFRNEPSAA